MANLVLFWFLVCYAATQLATQLRQRCIQVVRSNKEVRKRLPVTESNGTPVKDPGHMDTVLTHTFTHCCEEDIHLRRHTNRRGIEQKHKCVMVDQVWVSNIVYVNHDYYVDYYFNFSHVSI